MLENQNDVNPNLVVTNIVNKDKQEKKEAKTPEQKAKDLIQKGRDMLEGINGKKKKYRNRLLINYALMRLQQSPSTKKQVEHYEAEILAWMEKEKEARKQGKKGE